MLNIYMECRKIKITLVSATNLPDVRNFGLMKVFAKVSIKGGSETSKKTPTDFEGDTNPTWNFPIEYTIGEAAVQEQGINLRIRLYCERTFGDRYIGEVNIPIKSLFDKGPEAKNILSYAVAGTPYGRLNILYSFGEKLFVRKPSGWKDAAKVGFFVLVGGALILLLNEFADDNKDDESNQDVRGLPNSGDVHREIFQLDEVDGDVFYDPY